MSLQRVKAGDLEFWISPDHPNVAFTGRTGGCSSGPFRSLNVGERTEDSIENVRENRRAISRALGIPSRWVTVRQVHGSRALLAAQSAGIDLVAAEADAIVAGSDEPPIAVTTADCLPIALISGSGRGVVHAGWRGLCAGVIDEALAILDAHASKVEAFIGPSIGPCHFAVGGEVGKAFRARYPDAPDFEERTDGIRHFDLRAAARWVLRRRGVRVDEEDPPCTFCDQSFFSHRRDGVTGRQSAVVW